MTMRTAPPVPAIRAVKWVGSKGGEGVWQRIISEMPPHDLYIEPFAGTGLIARRKLPALETRLVDADRSAPALTMGPALIKKPAVLLHQIWTVQGDALQQLREWRGEIQNRSTLIYCDPPYLFSTRLDQERQYYLFEYGKDSEHRELLALLLDYPAQVMISGYRSEMYDSTLAAWRRIDIPAVTRGGGKVTECVWCNFPDRPHRHDYRYLGRNFRERERIRRKIRRWRRRLLAMVDVEREALIAGLREGGR
jgi:DNA adenine methylase